MQKVRMVLTLACAISLGGAVAWTQEKRGEDVEGKVRAAAYGYFSAMAFGDPDGLLKVTRHPLTIVKDGVVTTRDEKSSRNLLAAIAEKVKQSGMKNEDKGRILGNMISLFDEASVQFVGANTAHLTFVLKYGIKETGDSLNTLLIHRSPQNVWRVIGEVTDSLPVPPSYLIEIP